MKLCNVIYGVATSRGLGKCAKNDDEVYYMILITDFRQYTHVLLWPSG